MLEIQNLYASYKEGDILKGVSLYVGTGEIVTLLGRNGAGKTTTINSIMGFLPDIRGRILFDGKDICGSKPHDIARLGIGLVPEDRRIFPSLTILGEPEHHSYTKETRRLEPGKGFRLFPKSAGTAEAQGFPVERRRTADARDREDTENKDQPHPSRRTHGRARAHLVRQIENILNGIKQERIPILLVEQNTRFARKVAERHYILAEGEVVYSGTNNEFSNSRYRKGTSACEATGKFPLKRG